MWDWDRCFLLLFPTHTNNHTITNNTLLCLITTASRDDFLGECYVDLQAVGTNPEIVLPLRAEPGKERQQAHVRGSVTLGVELADASSSAALLSPESVARMKQVLKECLEQHESALDLSAFHLPGLPKLVTERLNYVQKLDLSHNKIAALPDLSRFTALEELDLTGNLLETLPEELGTVTTLRSLALNGNVLTALPRSLGQLGQLERLELNNNNLEALPKELGRLSHLEVLMLSGNKLCELPDSLGALRCLVNLDVSFCNLVRLPEALTLATRVFDLNLSNNRLECLPDGIGRMTHLVTLNVQNNRLRDLPLSIGLCTNLGQVGYGINLASNPIADAEMLAKYSLGADQLMDYLAKRYAMNNNPPVPLCPMPTDLGEGPLPAWVVEEQERIRRAIELQQRKAAGGGSVAAAPASSTAAAAAAAAPAVAEQIRPKKEKSRTGLKESGRKEAEEGAADGANKEQELQDEDPVLKEATVIVEVVDESDGDGDANPEHDEEHHP